MAPVEREVEVSECLSCSRVELGGESTCCGERMETIETTTIFESPEPEDIAQQVFGATSMELEICDILMAEGEASVSKLTEQFSHDRSTISRHLNNLVERGIVTKRSEALKEGGRVNVYSCVPPVEIRRKLKVGLCLWAQEALEKVDDRMQAKIEAAEQADGTTVSGSSAEPTANTTKAKGDSEAELKPVEQRNSLIDALLNCDWLR